MLGFAVSSLANFVIKSDPSVNGFAEILADHTAAAEAEAKAKKALYWDASIDPWEDRPRNLDFDVPDTREYELKAMRRYASEIARGYSTRDRSKHLLNSEGIEKYEAQWLYDLSGTPEFDAYWKLLHKGSKPVMEMMEDIHSGRIDLQGRPINPPTPPWLRGQQEVVPAPQRQAQPSRSSTGQRQVVEIDPRTGAVLSASPTQRYLVEVDPVTGKMLSAEEI
jgi:hypothetical protein